MANVYLRLILNIAVASIGNTGLCLISEPQKLVLTFTGGPTTDIKYSNDFIKYVQINWL